MTTSSSLRITGPGVNLPERFCDDDNVGSIKAIEACGGRLENVVTTQDEQAPRRRYWID